MRKEQSAVKAGKILIISGWRGAGKTTLCQKVRAAARQNGRSVKGVLSIARFEEGQKTGIELENATSGQRRLLARKSSNETHTSQQMRPCFAWNFEQPVLDWGNEILSQAVPCDILIVDELGPLEMESGQGWQAGLTAVDSGHYSLALVVIRPELLEQARLRWQNAEILTIDEKSDPAQILNELTHRFF